VLQIDPVPCILNYDLPTMGEAYINRIKSLLPHGQMISLVTEEDRELVSGGCHNNDHISEYFPSWQNKKQKKSME